MANPLLLQVFRRPFNFLRPEPEELRRLVPDFERALPAPQQVYLEEDGSTPLVGFPILLSRGVEQLRKTLEAYIAAEEAAQLAILKRTSIDRRAQEEVWEAHRALLVQAIENCTISSYGRQFPSIFWLFHSAELARLLKETPRRLMRLDLNVGRVHGDELKYRVFHRYLDRALNLTYDLVDRLAGETEEDEEALFPSLLTRMRDNVLILTEDYVSPDLAELGSYFNGYLRVDGRDLRTRLEALADWHAREVTGESDLGHAIRLLLGVEREDDLPQLLKRPGYLSYLTSRPSYDPRRLLSPELVQVWEKLLWKLKEFELLAAFRRRIIPVREEGGHMVCRDPNSRGTLGGPAMVRLSPATRPLDFLAAWVVDPLVDRFGLIYDIADFSEIVTALRRVGRETQERSFRAIFRFQRRINRLALGHRLKLEKYLGDGAFYSSREAVRPLVAAVQIQRYYRHTVEEGFPFDRGLRVALNYGQYRLLPIQGSEVGEGHRYEFFGHGVVELTRLVTGKAAREVEEIKTLLVSLGYPAPVVDRFFAPLTRRNVEVVDKVEEARRFYAYINRNGTLVNEGIVATGPFIEHLDAHGALAGSSLYRARAGERSFVVLRVEDQRETLCVGIRKLGVAKFKGLEALPVYEVVDGELWDGEALEEIPRIDLASAVAREFAGTLDGSHPEERAR